MPNEIPKKIRRQVEERADGYCEWCGLKIDNSSLVLRPHHIIKRRNRIHRPETLIMVCSPASFPETCHWKMENTELGYQLKLMLQQHYRMQGYSEKEVRALMGGRIYKRKAGR